MVLRSFCQVWALSLCVSLAMACKDSNKAPTKTTDQPSASASVTTVEPNSTLGSLTLVCNPFCDEIVANGRSLGPSPLMNVPMQPGDHELTLTRKEGSKKVTVTIRAGRRTMQRVEMVGLVPAGSSSAAGKGQ